MLHASKRHFRGGRRCGIQWNLSRLLRSLRIILSEIKRQRHFLQEYSHALGVSQCERTPHHHCVCFFAAAKCPSIRAFRNESGISLALFDALRATSLLQKSAAAWCWQWRVQVVQSKAVCILLLAAVVLIYAFYIVQRLTRK